MAQCAGKEFFQRNTSDSYVKDDFRRMPAEYHKRKEPKERTVHL